MKKNKKYVGASMIIVLIAVFVCAMLYNTQVTKPVFETQIIEQKQWEIRALGDASVGDGDTGFMYIMLYPHPASDPISTTYATNLSNGTAYEFADCVNCSMTNETPYTTAFDIALKIQVGGDDGYNATGGTWEINWTRMYYNETGLSISGEAMSEVIIATDGVTNRWYHYVLNNSGAGYQFSKGQDYNGSYNFEVWG